MCSPIPNINGDTRETLQQQFMDARRALLDAAREMPMPHARNYQLNPDQYAIDRREAEDRINMVKDLAEAFYQDALRLEMP